MSDSFPTNCFFCFTNLSRLVLEIFKFFEKHAQNSNTPQNKDSPRAARNIRSGGDDDNFAQVSRGLRQRDSRGYPHQRVSFLVAFATIYSSSDEEEALLFLVLEDDENSRFVFLSVCCRSYIIFFPRDMQKLFFFFSGERKGGGSTKSMQSVRIWENFIHRCQNFDKMKNVSVYFRMPSECFDEILNLIKEDITKMDTNYREAVISAEERLAITLR